ncbi:MAG: hypothetical protein K9K35_00690 [Rhodoferax sp.]|nr:hypothetical protein [Rhodoferax sp.]
MFLQTGGANIDGLAHCGRPMVSQPAAAVTEIWPCVDVAHTGSTAERRLA